MPLPGLCRLQPRLSAPSHQIGRDPGEHVADRAQSDLLRRSDAGIAQSHRRGPAGRGIVAALAAHRRLLVSARRDPDRRALPDRRAALGAVAARSRRPALPRSRLSGMSAEIREAIRAQALAMGFDAVGFAEARLAEAARADLAEYIDRGYHGDMGWLAHTAARRGDPQTLWPDARTVIVLGLNYGGTEDPLAGADDPERGMISVYA